ELCEQRRVERTGDPLDELRKLIVRYQFVSRPELPRFSGGAVGFLGYEAIHVFEPKVPAAERDELKLPEMIFMITGSLLIFDQATSCRLSFRRGSNPTLAAIRSIFIDAFVSSILHRTCFVSSSGRTLR